jgi:hypothetical protein
MAPARDIGEDMPDREFQGLKVSEKIGERQSAALSLISHRFMQLHTFCRLGSIFDERGLMRLVIVSDACPRLQLVFGYREIVISLKIVFSGRGHEIERMGIKQ